jgi:hypothetical protein
MTEASPWREDGQRESDRVIREVERLINGGRSVSPPFLWKPRRWPYLEAWLAARARAHTEEQPDPVSRIVSRETIMGQPITQKTAEG